MDDLYKALHSTRLYEQVTSQIETLVVNGQLKPGDRLPAERELGERLGVSRTVIREAIRSLEEKGLVEIRPGVGTFVHNGMSEIMRQSMGRMLLIDKQRGLENLMQVREILEPAIAAIAASKADLSDIEDMEAAICTMDNSLSDVEAFIAADHEFHLALARATKNQLIVYLIGSIVDSLTNQRRQIFLAGTGGPIRGQAHHKRICQAVKDHNGDQARAHMVAHLQQIREDTIVSAEND